MTLTVMPRWARSGHAGADADDAPALWEHRERRPDGGHDAGVVDDDLAIEGGLVGKWAVDRGGDGDPGVVDQDVEPSEVLHHGVDETGRLGNVRLVGLERGGADALVLQVGDHSLGLVGGGRVADGDVGSLIGQGSR